MPSGVSVHPLFIYLIFCKLCYYTRCLSLFWKKRWSFAFLLKTLWWDFQCCNYLTKKKKRWGRQNKEASLSVFLFPPQSVWKHSLSIPCRHELKPTHFKGASGWSSTCPFTSAWWGSSVVSFPPWRWRSPPTAFPFGWRRVYFSCLFPKMWILLRILNEIPKK